MRYYADANIKMRKVNRGSRKIKHSGKSKNSIWLFGVLILLCSALIGVWCVKRKFGKNEYIKSVISDDELQYQNAQNKKEKRDRNNKNTVQNYQKNDIDYLEKMLKEKVKKMKEL